MKMDEIRELIQLMEQSTLEELEFEQEGMKLSLKKSLTATPSPIQQAGTTVRTENAIPTTPDQSVKHESIAPQDQVDEQLHKIVSPMVGTFYQAPSPDADPYVRPGDRVNENTVVCIVEAMKLMNEIVAEVEGEIVKVLVENGQLVEYGQPLFLVRK